MSLLKSLLGTLLMVAALSACSNQEINADLASKAESYSDVDTVNIAVGKAAPAFSLLDANGKTVNLADFKGQSNVMLLFFRGHWCPFCMSQLEDIQSLFPELDSYNVQLLGISPDSAEKAQGIAEQFDQPYVFLSDADLAVAQSSGIRNGEKLPHPAVILINQAGEVVWYYVGEDYKRRPSASQLREVFKQVF